MSNHLKLNIEDLQLEFHELSQFETTKDIHPYKNIIGQKRAVESIDLGLLMDKKEYNLYISGPNGTGKTSYIIDKIEEYAKTLSDPCDWCYVYNFRDSNKPLALSLPTGTAPKFKEALNKFINELFKKVPSSFDNRSYENEKRKIVEKYETLLLELSNIIHEESAKRNFTVKHDENRNFIFIPLSNGKKMDIDYYNELSPQDKSAINTASNELKMLSFEILKEMSNLNKQMLEELKNLDNKISKSIISEQIESLKNIYGSTPKVINYLNMLELDIIQNINAFFDEADEESLQNENNKTSNNEEPLKFSKHFFKRYDVKIIVSNKKDAGAPVVYEDLPSYNSIFGKIEYENIEGNTITDFSMIRPGSLHLANGGFLLVNAEQLLANPSSWNTLKRCLKLERVFIQNSRNNMELFPIITLAPESIPLKVKIILIGSSSTYYLLSHHDYDFNKFFKIKAEFDNQIENSKTTIENILGFINNYISENNLIHINREGIKELLKYSCRLSENKNYFTAYMNKLLEVIDVSSIFAKNKNSNFVDENDIKKSIHELHGMHGLVKEKILRMYREGKYVIDLKNSKIGEINGLSVMDFGDCTVGQQHKITVTTFAGNSGVTNIEREVEMSGSIHSKGVMILSGFIGEFIGQNTFLSFNAKIVFEQLYSGIDGDSASAAELLALISSLSDIPIKQSISITGSVNQKGKIQPIGGVNDKIEGFFDICKIYGLDGTYGVVIPSKNINNLVLDHRVLDAVNKDLFHIYSASTIEDCIEILFDFTGIEMGGTPVIDFIKYRILSKIGKYRCLL
ncbi:Lon protease family protein [Clostridium aciditolerans]|uniref:endopeptidase La n=1 Tax=Clostridium aciditolerans TaxID=339861 RepID=A0A934M8L0_9CLOT|nr:ATP-binding protein [Clostridium aciditolerans]MBI6874966.1 AAA family ATPase [Clostridium aciditolerans]